MELAIMDNEPAAAMRIGATPCPDCAVCGAAGVEIYRDQSDRLFGAQGSWTFKRCSGPDCGLIWLDPMPRADEIWKAYANYYTHHAAAGRGSGTMGRLLMAMEAGYLAGKFGYAGKGGMSQALGRLLYLLPLRRRGVEGDVRFLDAVPGGKLLDVGCGSGDWLLAMRERGWRVAGTDFDENAVNFAKKRGLDVVCGALEAQNFAANGFDAVTLSHVIEHVPDPLAELKECLRILKPGGKLVLFTPNGDSLSHKVFKRDWRGLEPPRHLHIFSMNSMRRLLESAGFRQNSVRPHVARSVILDSRRLQRAGRGTAANQTTTTGDKLYARAFNLIEGCLLKWRPSAADCVAAIGIKG